MNRKTSTLFSLGVSSVLIAIAIWLLYRHHAGMWDDLGYWQMGGHHLWAGGMGFVMIVFWIVVLVAFILLLSGTITGLLTNRKDGDGAREPLEILRRRFARGEIDQAEFEDKRRQFTH